MSSSPGSPNLDDFDDILNDVLDSHFIKKKEEAPLIQEMPHQNNDSPSQHENDAESPSTSDDDDVVVERASSNRASPALTSNFQRPPPPPFRPFGNSSPYGAPRPAGAAPPFAGMSNVMSSMFGGASPFGSSQKKPVPLTLSERVRKFAFLFVGLYFGVMNALFEYPIGMPPLLDQVVRLHHTPWLGPFIIFALVELAYSFSDITKLAKDYLRILNQQPANAGGGMFGLGSIMKYMGIFTTGFRFLKACSKDVGHFMVMYIITARSLVIVLQFLKNMYTVSEGIPVDGVSGQTHIEL